eukprot:Phypoly_transcript_00844.p1 GENE.Phypoly_transcript_00844~~Phypoly_transcript_00844.p1  ORF type:complete len:1256 (+),score=270.15 Phypoly_transcript_00844:137-3904(+)
MEETQIPGLIRSLREGSDDSKIRALHEYTKCAKADPNLHKVFYMHKGLNVIMALLHSRDVGLLLATLDLVLDLASKRTYAIKLSKKGCVSFLVNILVEANPALCLPILRPLQLLCNEDSGKTIHGEGCVACMVVSPIIYFLSQGFSHLPPADIPNARATAISVLGSLARNAEYAEDVLKSGGVELFCRILKDTSPQDPAAVALASGIANLAVNGDVRAMIAAMDGLPCMVKLMRQGLPATKNQAIRAITNLAINKDNQVAFVKLGIIPDIVNLLRDAAICDHAASALQALVYNEAKAQEIAMGAGAIQLLMGMITSGSATGKARAALAIFFLVQQDAHQDLSAASIPLLVDLITNQDETCRINAIKALGALAIGKSNNQATIVATGGIAKAIQCLQQMKSAREGVIKAVGRFSGLPAADNAIIESGGLKALAAGMDGTESEKVEATESLALLLGSLYQHNTETGPPEKLHPFLDDFINNMPGYVLPTLTTMITSPNSHPQRVAILLLQFLCTYGLSMPNNLPLSDLINAGGSSALSGMRLVQHMFKEQPDRPPTILQPAIPGLILAANNTDPSTHESQQLATQLLMHLLADPGLVATITPKIDIPRVVAEFARAEQPHTVRAAADAIHCMLECNMQWEVAIAQAGGIRPCVRLLSSKDDDLLRPALSALRILAFAYAEDLARDGGVTVLLGTVMKQSDMQLVALAAQTLWVMLVSGSKLAREMLVSEGGVDVLAELVERGSVGAQVKLYAEQSLYLLRSGGDAGFTSITEEVKKYNRVCTCPRSHRVTQAPPAKGESRAQKLASMIEFATVELVQHTIACNSSNDSVVNAMLTNILLFIKYVPEKVIKDFRDTDGVMRFISNLWIQPDSQLCVTAVKILALLLEKGLVIPQTPYVEGLAAQARALPRHEQLEDCLKALNAAVRYPDKDPHYVQVAKLRAELATKKGKLEELRRTTVPHSDFAQMHMQLEALSVKLKETEANLVQAQELKKKYTAEKRQATEDIVAKERRINELSQEVSKLKVNLEKDATTHASKQADWQREVQKLKAELSKSAAQIGKEESQKDRRISELQAELSKIKSTSTCDQKALAEMEAAVERVTQENSDLGARVLSLEETNRVTMQHLEDKQRLLHYAQQKLLAHHPREPGVQNRGEILESIQFSEVSDMTELDTLEALLDAKLAAARARKTALHKHQIEVLRELVHCPICMSRTRDVALTPCGHTFCGECARTVADKQSNSKKCPICRKPTKTTQSIYL